MKKNIEDKIAGLIFGTAVGDSIGLPAEGFSADKIKNLSWQDWRHRFFMNKGMLSDDTEHTVMVSQALIATHDLIDFTKVLKHKFRWWLLGLPPAIGFGTLRAILKMWIFPWMSTGVNSAGNGPAMRSGVIGAFFSDDKVKMSEYVRASTNLTHRDTRAYHGSLAIAYAVSFAIKDDIGRLDRDAFFLELQSGDLGFDEEWLKLVDKMKNAIDKNMSVSDFALSLGLSKGISGYIYHTVPMAIYAWVRHYGNYRLSLESVLNCGGDTDTTGAIVGCLAGTVVGLKGIPENWVRNILDWPISKSFLQKTASELSAKVNGSEFKAVNYFWPATPLRNLFFLLIIFKHLFLRALPVRLRKSLKS